MLKASAWRNAFLMFVAGRSEPLSVEDFDPYDEDARFAVHLAASSDLNRSAAGSPEAAADPTKPYTDTVWAWAAAAVAEASLAAEFDEDARFAIHAATARANPNPRRPRPPSPADDDDDEPPPPAGVWAWAETAIKGQAVQSVRAAQSEARVRAAERAAAERAAAARAEREA